MSQSRLGSGLKTVEVPLQFLPTFNFLQKHRITYFHRLLIKAGSGSVLRIIAVTSSGECGMFHIDGQKKGNLNIGSDVESLTFDHKRVFIGVVPGTDCESNDGVLTLDFDTSSAMVRGNETADTAIKRFLAVCQHFLLGTNVVIHREGQPPPAAPLPDIAGIPRVSEARMAADAAVASASASSPTRQGGGGGAANSSICASAGGLDTPRGADGAGGGTVAGQQNNKKAGMTFPSFSLRRKAQGSTFQKLFAGFSGVWGKDKDGALAAGADGVTSSPRLGDPDDEDVGVDSTVSVENHEKQRKRMGKWHDEVLSRIGERDGLDAKERMLDQLSHLEATVKAQQALHEKGPKKNPEDELRQQRALSALVMFICRRQDMLQDARLNRVPLVRPKIGAEEHVPNSVPVLPSYVDAVRSQLLG